MEAWELIATERRALADQLATLTDQQWDVPSLCGAWSVRDVAAHLVTPHVVTKRQFLGVWLRFRGSFERANVVLTARQAARPTAELVADLRRYAESRFAPPGLGSAAPLTDVLVHGEDIRIPLGLTGEAEAPSWVPVLEFLVSAKARLGFVPGRLPSLRYTADDVAWSSGDGAEVHGPAAALALTLCGRGARLDALSGPGASDLRTWLRRRES